METTFQGSGVTLAVVLEPALKHGHLLNRNFDQPAFTYWWLAGTGGWIKDSLPGTHSLKAVQTMNQKLILGLGSPYDFYNSSAWQLHMRDKVS